MRSVFTLVLIAGLGLAGMAVYMARGYINSYQTRLAEADRKMVETVEVLVTKRGLKYGDDIGPADVRLVKWPKDALPQGTFASMGELFSEGAEEPRVALRSMEKNEAILAVKVSEPGEGVGIASQLDEGMRAFAIKVDVASGVSGFLRPGDRVDVYWTGSIASDQPRDNQRVTRLIEAGVQLIAVDQTANGETTGANIARTVTVAVNPQQVAALAQAQSSGNLSLSLLGPKDATTASAIQVDQRSLLGLGTQQVMAKPPDETCTVRTRKGGDVSILEIPCTN